jgi:hypothetical protein
MLIKMKAYRFLRFVPFWMIVAIDVFASMKHHNPHALDYLRSYFKNIIHHMTKTFRTGRQLWG